MSQWRTPRALREGQRISQPTADPADRLGEVIGPQGVAVAERRRVEAGLPLRGGIESGEDRAARFGRLAAVMDGVDDRAEVGPGDVL